MLYYKFILQNGLKVEHRIGNNNRYMTREALYVGHMTPNRKKTTKEKKIHGDANDEYDLNGRRFHLDCLRTVCLTVFFSLFLSVF